MMPLIAMLTHVNPLFLDWLALKIKALRFLETAIYQSTQYNIPEDLKLQKHLSENLRIQSAFERTPKI
jgi:hypothetical protein